MMTSAASTSSNCAWPSKRPPDRDAPPAGGPPGGTHDEPSTGAAALRRGVRPVRAHLERPALRPGARPAAVGGAGGAGVGDDTMSTAEPIRVRVHHIAPPTYADTLDALTRQNHALSLCVVRLEDELVEARRAIARLEARTPRPQP